MLNKAGQELGNQDLYKNLDGYWKMLDDMAENDEEVIAYLLVVR